MFDTEISYFPSLSTAPQSVRLWDFLHPDPATIERVVALRRITDPDAYKAGKKQLPAATISGTFSERKVAGLVHYNGLLCIDFDAQDNPGITPGQMRTMLSEFNEVAYAALSVGGKGVYAIIPTNCTDPVLHPRICDFMRTVFLTAGLLSDQSCKDVSRLRFVSYDENAHINPSASVFDAVGFIRQVKEKEREALKPTRSASPADKTAFKVQQYVEAIESGCADITDNYADWIRLGFALASEFGAEGENYFHRISQFNPKYDYHATAIKYADLLKNGSGRVKIGTFFTICFNHGIRL